MSDYLTDAEAAELEQYAREENEAGAAWKRNPGPALWSVFEGAKAALRNYVDAEDIRKLLAERKALREVLSKIEFAAHTRCGPSCPSCRGLRHGGPDFNGGPNGGHNPGCQLRELL